MSDRFRGAFLDLSLNQRGRRRVIHDDAELVVMNEETTGSPLAIRVERDGLHGQVANVPTHHDSYKTEKTA